MLIEKKLYTYFAMNKLNVSADDQSSKLLKVSLPVVSHQQCTELWTPTVQATSSSLPRGIDHEGMLCAGDLAGGKDTCLVCSLTINWLWKIFIMNL